MSEEEIIKALREMNNKKVEELEEPSKSLFNAVMKIADMRDALADASNQLQQENKQLKEKVGELTQSLNEQMKLTNEENLDCSKYAIENKQLKEVIDEVRKSLEDYQEYIDEAKEFYSDLEDDNVVKISNLQTLNNQMVRNYDLLQILDKVKGE